MQGCGNLKIFYLSTDKYTTKIYLSVTEPYLSEFYGKLFTACSFNVWMNVTLYFSGYIYLQLYSFLKIN